MNRLAGAQATNARVPFSVEFGTLRFAQRKGRRIRADAGPDLVD
jgi:hypothetical protein